ncbi:DUF1552 domain-containing protein [Agaribacterium haliotis]|uniref:DUF1552 domain-containing protein n=1 Tax=Agaribacterium haliotis TaxID=2013869 RepID=UPI0013044186|nr:DUF1552 domain-containing protein [Agaribacterium haliotis]
MMNIINSELKRRNFIKAAVGGGASLAMMSPFAQRALAEEAGFKRLIIWYVPEGCAQQAFWPAQTGQLQINGNASISGRNPKSNNNSIRNYVDNNMAGYCLQPLARHVSDISLYSGFQNRGSGSDSSDAHAMVIDHALTGGTPKNGSIDQVLGPLLKGSSAISSIYTPVYGHHVHNRGAADGYMSPVRTVGGGNIGSPNWNPMDVYNQIFPNGIDSSGVVSGPKFTDQKARLAILNSAAAELETVRCMGGDEARQKMEKILASFEKLEQDTQAIVDADEKDNSGGQQVDVSFDIPNGWTNTAGSRNDSSKYWNRSENFGKLVDIAIDTTIAAFALDRTRVSMLQFSASGTDKGPAQNDHYKKVGISDLEGGDVNDHNLGHKPDANLRRNQARIFRWYYGRMAYLIDRLKEIPDGNGSLFDSTLIVTASEFSMYNHRNVDMPYLIAGGLGGVHQTGRYLDVRQNGNFRHSADYFLGIARMLGTNLNRFGESTTPYSF